MDEENIEYEDNMEEEYTNEEEDEQHLVSNYELLNQKYKIKPPKIVVFGVGGGGCNAVNSMYNSGEIDSSVTFIVANTDLQSLNVSNVRNKILLGRKTTGGFGAGCDPEVGRIAAEESLGEIEAFLRGASMVFLTAGMGGGTGTGAAPVVAKKAKEMNILVAAIITKPFAREGAMALKMANDGIRKLKKYTDTLIIIPNQNLSKIANPKTTMQQSFAFVDKVLQSGVRSIVDLITKTGFINLDFADIRTVMKKMGRAVMGTGEASGPNRAVRAVEEAISNPLLDNISIKGAKGVILNITSSTNLTFHEYDNATKRLNEELDNVDNDAIILHGNVFDPDMQDTVRVSIFATGIDSDDYEEEKENVVERKESVDDCDAGEEELPPEKEYSYVEEKEEEGGDFFDLGDIKKYREAFGGNKNNKKVEKYNRIVERITQFATNKEENLSSQSIAGGTTMAQKDKKETESKKGLFSGLFSSSKGKLKENKKLEIKPEKQEKDLSIMEVENFDSIDIDVYEVPAYLRKKNE